MAEKQADGAWLKVGTYRRSTLDKLSKDAEWAWFRLQLHSAQDDNRGRIAERDLLAALGRKISKRKADELLGELVDYELVEYLPAGVEVENLDERGRVEHMATLSAASWVLPRFQLENPPADIWHDQVRRDRRTRYNALKRDGDLCRRVQERDRNTCRYCGVRVDWKNRNGDNGGTYDHVDPDGPNSISNVVVSCRRCNGRKRDRTPGQWIAAEPHEGRTLKKPGTTVEQAEAIDRAARRGELGDVT